MNDRAKQIAAKIVADVWPYTWLSAGVMRDLEAAVEKHMRPHQVRDHVGIIWEQMSNGCYRTLNGAKTDYIDRNFGPLTQVHGEPMPDAGEVERLRERIAELESEDCYTANAALQNATARQQKRIVELERQLAAVKAEPAKPQPEAIWQKVSEREWVFGVPVRGIIWQPIAKVVDGCDWFWHLTDLSQKGHNQHFRDAIEAATAVAEKAMGVK